MAQRIESHRTEGFAGDLSTMQRSAAASSLVIFIISHEVLHQRLDFLVQLLIPRVEPVIPGSEPRVR